MSLLADLRKRLSYSPETGEFLWLYPPRGWKPGRSLIAGTVNANGYRVIVFRGKFYYAHRLAWLFVHGHFPDGKRGIDHKNRVRDDNRIANLRRATNAQNLRNGKPHEGSTSAYRGVSLHRKTGKWRAQISFPNEKKHIGLFPTPEDAARAYDEAAKEHFGEFAKLNFPQSTEASP